MEKSEIQDEELRDPIPGEYGHPIPREIMFREMGFTAPYSRHLVGRRVVSATLATKAVHTLCTKEIVNRRKFKLPTGARTTFHMAFSADGTKLASCHGDHNVYVCDVRNGEVLQTLSGHPRTPWCVVFHPTQNDVLASGCLAGHVRVWDLKGGSEVLVTDSGTVIASLAFHPTVRLLAIATFNEIIFWDWDLPHPLARCSTENTKEKVRLVRFDRLGKSLITGITNFPNPPVREATFQASSNHRPNILSRGNTRSGSINFYIHERPDGPVDVANDTVERNNDPNSREMAEFAESFAAAAEAEAASAVLNRRQDRFQESYRQLVNHYQDLVTHYQQFLRSRIPRLLETSRIVREQPTPGQPSQSSIPGATVMPQSVTPIASTSQAPQPSEPPRAAPAPVDEEVPGPSRLMQLEARLLEIINTPEASNPNNSQNSSTTTTTTNSTNSSQAENSSIPNRLRNDTDLRNIEMLAQNILEMQNLCSQARRDAPLTIETQHIIELQNIRRHLELLQEQTRELQSSIRATLTSLARGSLDALRSHVTSTSTTASLNSFPRTSIDPLRSQVPHGNDSGYFTAASSQGTPSHGYGRAYVGVGRGSISQSTSTNPSNAILRITIGPRLTASAELIPPSGSESTPSTEPTRTQVPPAVSMQYELPEHLLPRNTNSTATESEATEPVASTSRGFGRNTGEGSVAGAPRRYLREFQVFTGRASDIEQHARNCPFNGRDQLQRPPPRMRCLAEMGETPTLTVWPTIETGLELEIRNFRDLHQGNSRRERETRTTQEPRIALDPPLSHVGNGRISPSSSGNAAVSSYFNQWYVGVPNWISNDVGVHVFLTIRRVAENIWRNGGNVLNEDLETFEGENWQRLFPCGFAFIHPWARQGHRPERRAHRREIRRGIFPCGSRSRPESSNSRYGVWEDSASRSTTNNSQSSSSSVSSATSNSTSTTSTSENLQTTRNSGRQIPTRINGILLLSYYLRAGDEVIPVYSVSYDPADDEQSYILREGPMPHVFFFPIGLLLRGSSWEHGTQTVGILWPPVSTDEEHSLNEYRRSEGLLPVFRNNFRAASVQRSEIFNLNRYRLTYTSSHLEINLPRGGSINLIQPGLLLLDAVTTFANFERPRPSEGTVYLDYVSPLLEALETLFGFRQRNPVLSGAGINAIPSPSRGSIYTGWIRGNPWRLVDFQTNQSPRDTAEPSIIRQEVNGIMMRRNAEQNAHTGPPAENRGNPERSDRQAERPGRSEVEESRNNTVTQQSTSSSRTGRMQESTRESESADNASSEGSGSTRRVIRLAVDTATADILRRDQHSNPGHIARAIESRIERVLNERGNRGGADSNPGYINSMVYLPVNAVSWNHNLSAETNGDSSLPRQLRLLLTHPPAVRQLSTNSVTSATQTSASYLRSSNQASTTTSQATTTSQSAASPASSSAEVPSTTTSVEPPIVRTGRRRPFPGEQGSTSASNSSTPNDEDILPSPSRIPRLSSYGNEERSPDMQFSRGDRRNDLSPVDRDWTTVNSNSASGSEASPVNLNSAPVSSNSDSSSNNSNLHSFTNQISTNSIMQAQMDLDDDDDDEPPPLLHISAPSPTPTAAERAISVATSGMSNRNETTRADPTATNQDNLNNINDLPRERDSVDLERSFRSIVNSFRGNQSADSLVFRFQDVLSPVGVDVENEQPADIPDAELNSPQMVDMDGEGESPLDPFESPSPTSVTTSRREWMVPTNEGVGRGNARNGGLPNPASNDPLLQTVGEATARETIAAIGLISRVPSASLGVERPGSNITDAADRHSNTVRVDDGIPHVAPIPYPFPYEDHNPRHEPPFLGPADVINRYMYGRGHMGPTNGPSEDVVSSLNPLLRTIDEATARNAIRTAVSYPLPTSMDSVQEPAMQAESPTYPFHPYGRERDPNPGGNPSGRSNESSSRSARARSTASSTPFGDWILRRHRSSGSHHTRWRVSVRTSDGSSHSSTGSQELSGSARTRLGLGSGIGNSTSSRASARGSNGSASNGTTGGAANDHRQRPPSSHPYVYRQPQHHLHFHHAAPANQGGAGGEDNIPQDSGARFYPGYIPEILITPRARPPTYYTMDAATTAFLSSRIQKWDFSNFYIPDITDRTSGLVTASCSLHSDATLDVSSDSEFIAVLQPSDNGSYSAVGIYSLRDDNLGDSLYTYHFDQNTVSVSISPSCDYIVVGYAGRGPFYRIVHPSRNIGQILSLTREGQHVKLVPVKELFADTQPALMSINCMHWVPIPGYGIIYGTNTGEVVLLS